MDILYNILIGLMWVEVQVGQAYGFLSQSKMLHAVLRGRTC